MEALLALDGVGVPTASALLHFAFPSDYPMLDVRALESLGRRGRTEYSVSFWCATSVAADNWPTALALASARWTRRCGSTPRNETPSKR